jgi:hypothetical protein
VAVLEELISAYPAPPFIRSDNGLEFNAQAFQIWCKASDPPVPPTSSWDPGGKTALQNRSTDDSRMSSATPSC